MSDREFENYLTLLAGLLRLDARQRGAIADELRVHLEDRLDELLARGVSREDAVRQALSEFGDAAGLAGQFVSISRNRKRRWLMRLTSVSVAATLLLAAGLAIFWPGRNAAPGLAEAMAQAGNAPAERINTGLLNAVGPEANLSEVLNSRMEIDYKEVPLWKVMSDLTTQTKVTFHLNPKKLEEAGVSLDTPVTSHFPNVRLSTWLEIALGEMDLTFVQKDDLIVVTTPEDAESQMIIRVYDCRDLLAMPGPKEENKPAAASGTAAVGRGGMFSVGDILKQRRGGMGGAMGLGGPEGVPAAGQPRELTDYDSLIEMITTIVKPDSWDDVGGPGSLDCYKGLLAVSQTDQVHKQVERFLDMLREAAGLEVTTGTVVR